MTVPLRERLDAVEDVDPESRCCEGLDSDSDCLENEAIPVDRPQRHSIEWEESYKDAGIRGWDLYRKLGSPRYVVAPMVEQSELAFRMQTRRYGAELCYTPMIHSRYFTVDAGYRKMNFEPDAGGPEDRPLIAQFCGHSPMYLLEAGKLIQDRCDAVDVNMGCPQAFARRGHYGAFLLQDWDTVQDIVWTMNKGLKVPVTCKIRLLESIDDTVELSKLLVGAGCAMLTVHGRTKDELGCNCRRANWDAIKRIVEAVPVPVIANGSIATLEDVKACMEYTGAAGVMSSEAVLCNPGLFSNGLSRVTGRISTPQEMCLEYLELTSQYPILRHEGITMRGHFFKMIHGHLSMYKEFRIRLATARGIDAMVAVLKELLALPPIEPLSHKHLAWYYRHRTEILLGLPEAPRKGPQGRKYVEPEVNDGNAMLTIFGDSGDY